MSKDNPFLLFSWRMPFLPAFKDFLMRVTNGKPGMALVITPNKRPWRYLVDLFREEKKTLALPKLMPFNEIAALWRVNAVGMPGHMANTLDQVALLYQCAMKIAPDDPQLAGRFAEMDMAEFLPWGLRLSRLLEELFQHGLKGRDIPLAGDEVADPASRLLSALGRIDNAWREMLRERNWSTPGLDNFLAAEAADDIPGLLLPRVGRPVYIIGFSALNGAQKKLFHRLWQAGAQVCLHGDPGLATGRWDRACKPIYEWAKAWRAGFETVAAPAVDNEPEYGFYAAYDAHSQLRQMAADLARIDDGHKSSAIVLPGADMLMPVLHDLPDKEVNITIGYPLSRSPLAALLAQVFKPREQEGEEGKIYWRDALNLVNLPFWGMLEVQLPHVEKTVSLKEFLARLDAVIRSGSKFFDLHEEVMGLCASLPDSVGGLLVKSYEAFAGAPARVCSLKDLAVALQGICDLLLTYGQGLLHRFPLDAEGLARLREGIIPVLLDNELADEPLSAPALYAVLSDMLAQERIAFEADPLVGLQIMGMLETRLLHFDHVFILDASDDILPGVKSQDPLLPDSLRPQLGLPDAASRNAVVAYNVFRLCASARDAHFYWAEGSTPSALASGKKYRSRFVEQLIWRMEGTEKKLLKTGEGKLRAAASSARSCPRIPRAIARTVEVNNAMLALLKRPLSATMLKTYLSCPLLFALQRFFRLQSPVCVEEGEDYQLIGECAHKALENYFNARKGKPIREGELSADGLIGEWDKVCADASLATRLPPASFLALELTAPAKFAAYIKAFPYGTTVVECERRERMTLHFNKQAYLFTGRFDRVDEREDGYYIIDYKTGTIEAPSNALWKNSDLFDELQQYMDTHVIWDKAGDELFGILRESLSDPQLPLYMLMGSELYGDAMRDARIVKLRDGGKEAGLFTGMDQAQQKQALNNCRIAIGFVLAHMQNAPEFSPFFGVENCEWCDMRSVCA